MDKVITKQMIYDGCEQHLIRFVPNSILEEGTVCSIGEYWFFLSGTDAENQSPEQFITKISIKDLIDLIYGILEDFRETPEYEEEYLYYYYYLTERLQQKGD